MGNYICDVEYLSSEGKRGASLKFKAATAVGRTMHLTPQFAIQHEGMAVTLLKFSSGQPSKWVYAADEPTFLQTVAKANHQKKPTQVIVFLTEADLPRFGAVKLRYTAAQAFADLAVLDRGLSATGMTSSDQRWVPAASE